MTYLTDCVRCGDPDQGEPQYDGYGMYCGRLCPRCWSQDSRRDFGVTRMFDPDYAGEALEPEDY